MSLVLKYNIPSNNTSISISIYGSVTTDWNDGNIESNSGTNVSISHTYSTSGVYDVSISNNLSQVRVHTGKEYLTDIISFNSNLTNLTEAFSECTSLVNVPNTIPSLVTILTSTFEGCSNLNSSNLSTWNVSNVQSMSNMFRQCTNFNQSLNNWNMSNVQNTNSMFQQCSNFNQPLNNWNMSNITQAGSMFSNCSLFNQPLNNWDISNVTDLSGMFFNCPIFNQNLNSWNTSNVTNVQNMFASCINFNQDLSSWNVSKITNFNNMFYNCTNFNQDISGWNISNALSINGMFYNCSNFNQDLSSWNVSNITNFIDSFNGCINFNQDLSAWDVSNSLYLSRMFANCTNFNQPLNIWNVSKAIDINGMFRNCSVFNQDLSSWNVSNVTTTAHMFANCSVFNQDLSSWNVSNVTTMANMFVNCSLFNQDLSSWNISNVTTMANMLDNTNISIPILNSILNQWSLLSVQPNVVFGTANLFYSSQGLSGYNLLTSSPNNWIIDASYKIPCFHEDSLILTMKDQKETYVPVKYLRRGDLIKTYKHGYVPLYGIGTSQIYHDANHPSHHQLYVCPKYAFPGAIQDLLLTSEHSILVDSLTDTQKRNLNGKIYITDDKYRLPIMFDERREMYKKSGYYTIYHFALENNNYHSNYGIYANGILVETCSKGYLTKYSKLKLL